MKTTSLSKRHEEINISRKSISIFKHFNMSFLINRKQFIDLYGERVYAIGSYVQKLHQRSVKITEHIVFLKQCKREGVIPRGMYVNNMTNISRNNRLILQTMIKIRNNTLEWQQRQRKFVLNDLATQEKILKRYLNQAHCQRNHNDDLSWMNKNHMRKREALKLKHKRKLETLIQQQQKDQQRISSTMTSKIDTSNVVNKSSVTLSKTQMETLAKGLKFIPTPKSIDVVDIIANSERSLSATPKITKQLAVSEIATFTQQWKPPKRDNVRKEEREGLNQLKKIKNIVIVQADKGGKVVVMDRMEYVEKIEEKLSNATLYERVSDPTTLIKKRISELTTRLFKANRINGIEKYELSSVDDLPRIRGQPNLHKQNHPMRIVTCARNTILAPIARFAFTFIKELRDTIDNTVCNTTKFIEEISKVELDKDDRFVSLDVEDLFTNIPVTRAVDIAIHRIGNSEKFCESDMTKTDLKQLLLLSLNNSYVEFNGKFYRQKLGLPMGNTLSPILADLYMHEYMNKCMGEGDRKRMWRYVDDIIMITKMSEAEVKNYVIQLNSIRSRIRCTYEYEQNDKLNFLDTTLSKNSDGSVGIRWFRKNTSSDRLLDYHSAHHKSIKRNIAINMASRIAQTTKDPVEQREDLDKLREMLGKSNYPSNEIEQHIISAMRSTKDMSKQEDEEEMKHCISLPFMHGIGVLKRKLEQLKIKVFFTYRNKLQSICTTAIKPRSKSNIYQITCDCGAIYNGETKIGFEKRMSQHERTIEKDEHDSKSEMVQHHQERRYQCLFNPSRAFIISNEIDRRKRRIKESIYSTINHSINRRDEIDKLWFPLLYKSTPKIKNT